MPTIQKTDQIDYLRAYRFHGLDLTELADGQAMAQCPFCGKEDKWRCSVKTGLWDCKVCMAKGNLLSFLGQLLAGGIGAEPLQELAADRKLLSVDTLAAWKVGWSHLTADALVPGYGPTSRLSQLYRYARMPNEARAKLMPTPGLKHGLHGLNLYRKDCARVYLCEGCWDGMTLWEALLSCKEWEGGLELTSNPEASLLASASVLAVPSASTFAEAWLPFFAGKEVVLLYDSDHPRLHNGKVIPPAGLLGMQRVAGILARAAQPPLSISWLAWGPEGFDPARKSGFDVRDWLAEGADPLARLGKLIELLQRIEPIPAEWVGGRTEAAIKSGSPRLEHLHCQDWKTLKTAWRKAMHWTDNLDRALSLCLASIMSTKAVGDPIWLKLVGPPSCGKSVLCEAFAVAKDYVEARSSVRGFHSGFKSDAKGDEDHSLVERLRGKTLVIKDGDTLLQSPNLGQILSEIRDLYDRASRPYYRNGVVRQYEGVLFTIILAGTEALRALDSSELGERFLDVVICLAMEEEDEREIGWQVVNQAFDEMDLEADGAPHTQETPEMQEAKRLTGGYITYLRTNANRLFRQVQVPDAVKRQVQLLAEFTSFMRTRPSKRQEETAQRELSFRLIKQLGRLCKALAAVLGKRLADDPLVMERIRRTALDTSRGRTLKIAELLYGRGSQGASLGSITSVTGESDEKQKAYLRFLAAIGVVERVEVKVNAVTSGVRWVLTPRLQRLYQEVFRDA